MRLRKLSNVALGEETVGEKGRNKSEDEQSVSYLECHPDPRWFSQEIGPDGRPEVWLRIQVTGLRSKKYGPFPDPYQAMLYLDVVLDKILDDFCEAESHLGKYLCPVTDPTDKDCRRFRLGKVARTSAKKEG